VLLLHVFLAALAESVLLVEEYKIFFGSFRMMTRLISTFSPVLQRARFDHEWSLFYCNLVGNVVWSVRVRSGHRFLRIKTSRSNAMTLEQNAIGLLINYYYFFPQ